MIADTLLSRLEGVRRTGVDRWLAKCPVHDDKHPSLGIKESDSDRVLWSSAGLVALSRTYSRRSL